MTESTTFSRTSKGQTHRGQDIAVVGIGGRYPHADDLEGLWSVLREGRDCVTEVPAVDRFDPLHFGISPRQAAWPTSRPRTGSPGAATRNRSRRAVSC